MKRSAKEALRQRIEQFPDKRLLEAALALEDYNSDAQTFIMEEVKKRGLKLEKPEPTSLEELELAIAKEPEPALFAAQIETGDGIKIRYHPGFGWVMTIMGGFVFLTGITIGPGVQIITGALFLLLGRSYLKNTALVITPTEVQIKNPLGMTVKRYPYTELRIENGRLYADDRKVKMPLYMLNKKDLENVENR